MASAPNGTIDSVQVPVEPELNGPRPAAREVLSNTSDVIQSAGPQNEIQGPSMNSRIKRRPFKHSCGSDRLGVDTWVLLDADGNTQEVSILRIDIIIKMEQPYR